MTPKGPWSEEQVLHFLEASRVPLRLACNGNSGFPVLASLWFVPLEGRLWCATQQAARTVALLGADSRCAFEVAQDTPPYRGVRGQATALLEDARGAEILELLIDRYLGDNRSDFARWLLARADRETAISIEPRNVLSWDFRDRMGDGT